MVARKQSWSTTHIESTKLINITTTDSAATTILVTEKRRAITNFWSERISSD